MIKSIVTSIILTVIASSASAGNVSKKASYFGNMCYQESIQLNEEANAGRKIVGGSFTEIQVYELSNLLKEVSGDTHGERIELNVRGLEPWGDKINITMICNINTNNNTISHIYRKK